MVSFRSTLVPLLALSLLASCADDEADAALADAEDPGADEVGPSQIDAGTEDLGLSDALLDADAAADPGDVDFDASDGGDGGDGGDGNDTGNDGGDMDDPPSDRTLYVSPSGNDALDGLTPEAAWRSIQTAVDRALPGDTIVLGAGEYFEDIASRVDATEQAPITIRGMPEAIVRGQGATYVITIEHDHHHLEGFSVDGFFETDAPEPTMESYRKKLIYVRGTMPDRGPRGLALRQMTIRNARDECVRLRYFVEDAEIAYNTITDCGIEDFRFDGGGKNGEAIYVGTAASQWDDGKNPTTGADATRAIWIHHNTIDVRGNECVDVKEGAREVLMEFNECSGSLDDKSAGINLNGNSNVVRYNTLRDHAGSGVRFGSARAQGVEYGVNNEVYSNLIRDNDAGGLNIRAEPQGKICGNVFSGHPNGDVRGTFGKDYKEGASRPCPE